MISAFGVEHGEIDKSMTGALQQRSYQKAKKRSLKPYKPYGTVGDKMAKPLIEGLSFAAHPKAYVKELRMAR